MRPVEGHPVHQSARAGIVGFVRNASRPGRLSTDYTYQKRTSMSEQTERRRIRLVTGGILLALALVVVALRLYRIAEIPSGIQSDEGPDGVYALQVLQGEHAIFFPEKASGREAMGVYTIALTTSLLGRTLLAFRLPTALASVGTVFVVFWLGRLLFGRDDSGRATPWRGLLVGGVGAGLLAVSIGQTTIARAGLRANFLPLLLSLCLALLWWGWRERKWWAVTLAGMCAGLLPYTYIPARFTPFLFLIFGLSFALPLRSFTRESARAELPWAAIFVVTAGLVAAPILVYFALHPEHFFIRSKEVWFVQDSQGGHWAAFLKNAWEHLLVFGFHGDQNERYNFAGRPMLNPWEAFFFWLGAGMTIWRWQRPAYRLILLWLGILLLPAALARDIYPGPNTLRMIGAAPAVYLLIGVGVWEAFRLLGTRWRSSQLLRGYRTGAVIAVAVVVSGSILAQGVHTYRTYFHEWATTPAFDRAYDAEWAEAAQVLNAQPHAEDTAYLLPYPWFDEHYAFEYLYHGAAPAQVVHITHTTDPHDLAQTVEASLAAIENVTTVKFVDWDNDLIAGDTDGDEYIVILLNKYGRYLGSDAFANFQLHTYTDIALDHPWTFFEQLEPLTVHYDGGIDLLGLALGQIEQLSSQQPLNLGLERSLWVNLRWQTIPGLDTDFAVSLRLHNAEGASSYQKDFVLGNSTFARTRHWPPDEAVDTLFHLELPADLAPGEYELRLIVYSTETLTPTVEIDVWEPELLLARLRLGEFQ